jgi:hypothetical protein
LLADNIQPRSIIKSGLNAAGQHLCSHKKNTDIQECPFLLSQDRLSHTNIRVFSFPLLLMNIPNKEFVVDFTIISIFSQIILTAYENGNQVERQADFG